MLYALCGKGNEKNEGGEYPKLEVGIKKLWLALPQTSCTAPRKLQVPFPQRSPGCTVLTLLPSFHRLCFLSYRWTKATLCTTAHSCTTAVVYNSTTVCAARLSAPSDALHAQSWSVPSPLSLYSPSLGGSAGPQALASPGRAPGWLWLVAVLVAGAPVPRAGLTSAPSPLITVSAGARSWQRMKVKKHAKKENKRGKLMLP